MKLIKSIKITPKGSGAYDILISWEGRRNDDHVYGVITKLWTGGDKKFLENLGVLISSGWAVQDLEESKELAFLHLKDED